MKPMHLARAAQRRGFVPQPGCDAPAYPPGHFIALARRYNWPPEFEPRYQRTREVQMSEIMRVHREKRAAQGDTGTIVGLSRSADKLISQRMLAGAACTLRA